MNTKDSVSPEKEIFFRLHRTCRHKSDGTIGMDETFYMNNDIPDDAGKNLLHCFAFGISRWGSSWQITKEYGKYISFNFFLEGGVIIQTSESTFQLQSGDMLIARRTPLVMRTPPGGMARKYCLLLSNTLVQSAICDSLSPRDPVILHMNEPEKIAVALEAIGEYVRTGSSRRELESLIFNFLQELRQQHQYRDKTSGLLEKAQFIMQKSNFCISRFELAQQCGVSLRTLTRVFDRHLNCPPGQYIIRCRMKNAARMLCLSDEPIKNIAAECGFSSPMFFAREFRQHYHCPPTVFRKKQRSLPNSDMDF